MRLALVVAGGVDRSGRERVTPALLCLIERLAARHDVAVYVLRYHQRPCDYPLLGATVHDLGSPRGWWRRVRALTSALRRDGPFDVVHGYQGLPAGLSAALAARRLGMPAVVTFDSGEFVDLPAVGGGYGLQRRARDRLAVRLAARLSTAVTVCSRYQAALAHRRGFQAIVVPLGIDLASFPATDRQDGPPWRLLQVASLNAVKDQPTLLHALAHLAANGVDVHLDLVGEDTLGGAIPALARELGLAVRVTCHGVQPTAAVARQYQRAHLFVLSSRHEAACVAVLEAAAAGVPVVGTRVGFVADWAPDRAVAVDPGDATALADAIQRLLGDPPARAKLAAASRPWVVEHDAAWTAHAFERIYRSLADHAPLPHFV